jgi:hypothetical protein
VHVNFNLGEARSITISRVGEHHIARHKLGPYTNCHTFLHIRSRNPANLGRGFVRAFTFDRVFTFPALLHLKSKSLVRARNNGDWVLLKSGACLSPSQGENAIRFVPTTTRRRRRSNRLDNTWNTRRSSGRAFGGSNGRSSGGIKDRRCTHVNSLCDPRLLEGNSSLSHDSAIHGGASLNSNVRKTQDKTLQERTGLNLHIASILPDDILRLNPTRQDHLRVHGLRKPLRALKDEDIVGATLKGDVLGN